MPGSTTKYNGVPMKSSSNSDSLSSLICKVVLSSSAWSGHEPQPFHIKAISLSVFLLSTVVSCKAGQRNVFKLPWTLKFFPPKPWYSICLVLTFLFCHFFYLRHITEADSSHRMLQLYPLAL